MYLFVKTNHIFIFIKSWKFSCWTIIIDKVKIKLKILNFDKLLKFRFLNHFCALYLFLLFSLPVSFLLSTCFYFSPCLTFSQFRLFTIGPKRLSKFNFFLHLLWSQISFKAVLLLPWCSYKIVAIIRWARAQWNRSFDLCKAFDVINWF